MSPGMMIAAIENARKQSQEYGLDRIMVTIEFADKVTELLKKQEPVEPRKVMVEQAGPLYYRCYCHLCGHLVGNVVNKKVTDVHEKYCAQCGQALKWD